jgi:hypothetical protein
MCGQESRQCVSERARVCMHVCVCSYVLYGVSKCERVNMRVGGACERVNMRVGGASEHVEA